jgi:hypothetical protein
MGIMQDGTVAIGESRSCDTLRAGSASRQKGVSKLWPLTETDASEIHLNSSPLARTMADIGVHSRLPSGRMRGLHFFGSRSKQSRAVVAISSDRELAM